MLNKIGKYGFGFLAMILATGCAKNNFEWVKVNPDKINLAKSRTPYSADVRQINLVLNLKEKERILHYPESDGFFAKEENQPRFADNSNSPLQKNINKSQRYARHFKVKNPSTIVTSRIGDKKTGKKPAEVSDADKLNAALKIPLNSKALKPGKNTASFGPTASEIREMAFNDIKKKNPEIEQKYVENQQRGKNLMWAGLVLVVLGGIMGFIFGRSAFLIALAGVVFAGIGYFFRI